MPPGARSGHERFGRQTTWHGRQPASASGRQPVGASVGDGVPDQLGAIDDEIRFELTWITRCANLADADDVVQPAIVLAVGQVKHRPDDLTASRRVGAPNGHNAQQRRVKERVVRSAQAPRSYRDSRLAKNKRTCSQESPHQRQLDVRPSRGRRPLPAIPFVPTASPSATTLSKYRVSPVHRRRSPRQPWDQEVGPIQAAAANKGGGRDRVPAGRATSRGIRIDIRESERTDSLSKQLPDPSGTRRRRRRTG